MARVDGEGAERTKGEKEADREGRRTCMSGAGRRAMTTLGEISRSKAMGRSASMKSSYLQSTSLPSVEGYLSGARDEVRGHVKGAEMRRVDRSVRGKGK